MKETGHSADEYMEAQDRLERHKEGRKEAAFYRQFLDNFYRAVINQVSRTDVNEALGKFDLNKTELKLKQFAYLSEASLQQVIKEAAQSAGQTTGVQNINVNYETKTLAEMTPMQFHQYIEKQKSSLIKD